MTVAGEITTRAKFDYVTVVRGVVVEIGFDSDVDDLSRVDRKGLSDMTCEVLVRIISRGPGHQVWLRQRRDIRLHAVDACGSATPGQDAGGRGGGGQVARLR